MLSVAPWDENPIMSETEPSSDPPIQKPCLLDSPARRRQLGALHIVLSTREANSSCYLQKESLKMLLKIMGSTMGPSSLYWWNKVRSLKIPSNHGHLLLQRSPLICCRKAITFHGYLFNKSHSMTPLDSRLWAPCHQQHGVPIMHCCLILSTACWRPSVHNRSISIASYTLHSSRSPPKEANI